MTEYSVKFIIINNITGKHSKADKICARINYHFDWVKNSLTGTLTARVLNPNIHQIELSLTESGLMLVKHTDKIYEILDNPWKNGYSGFFLCGELYNQHMY